MTVAGTLFLYLIFSKFGLDNGVPYTLIFSGDAEDHKHPAFVPIPGQKQLKKDINMIWQEVCENPALRDLPFKIELNELGQLVMSPVKVYHSAYQGEISYLLRVLSPRKGRTLTECAINTQSGTKVADIAWASIETFSKIKSEAECSVAPEICIEVLSSSNTRYEIKSKSKLYFKAGAAEVWICDKKGNMSFRTKSRKIKHSSLVPKFPLKLDI